MVGYSPAETLPSLDRYDDGKLGIVRHVDRRSTQPVIGRDGLDALMIGIPTRTSLVGELGVAFPRCSDHVKSPDNSVD